MLHDHACAARTGESSVPSSAAEVWVLSSVALVLMQRSQRIQKGICHGCASGGRFQICPQLTRGTLRDGFCQVCKLVPLEEANEERAVSNLERAVPNLKHFK